MVLAPSLLDAPPASPLASATEWLGDALSGSLAIGLCVIAVACLGFVMMTGRLAIRDAARVALGCFVLLVSPVIANGMSGIAGTSEVPAPAPVLDISAEPSPAPLPPANYDPYAGASLRVD